MKGGEVREWLMVCVVVVGLNLMNGNECEAEAQVPCYFIFGDSLVDNGNNNDLATTAKADYSPYGIDFSDGPTGRFSNGKNLVDVIAELLGFDDYIPPYATVKDQDILGVNYDASAASGIRHQTPQLSVGGRICMNEHSYRNTALMQVVNILGQFLGFDNLTPPCSTERGSEGILMGVNYGSGGAGIRDETGEELGDRISMNNQLLNHQTIVSRIATLLGGEEGAANYLSKCIYSIGMGSNDYINNYLLPEYYPTSHLYTPEQYASALIEEYSQQLRTLYKLGAKKMAIFALGLIGCTPAEMTTYATNGTECVLEIDNDVKLFNEQLKSLVDDLNNDLTDAKFIYINVTEISSGNLSAVGITISNAPCCIVSSNIGKGQCIPNQVPCSNRSIYAFWDGFHPTEVTNAYIGTRAYSAQTSYDAYPIDISSLAQL
ncbi:GDSL esterase/lipase At1g29670-like [Camellia sinensis]|uniref:GDSL esterase/lipase At1g29670-like n=1 Tax=Camellia sinensis TaxID=4442 RepID=UPI0010355C66|nr:GDSL esterase/lipase At1g29670-like [Camellia sinensis]